MNPDVVVRLEDLQAALAACPVPRLLVADQQVRVLCLQASVEHQSLVVVQQSRDARVQARIPAQVNVSGEAALYGEALRTWVASLERTWGARLAWARWAQAQLQQLDDHPADPADLDQGDEADQEGEGSEKNEGAAPIRAPGGPDREAPPVQIRWPRPPGVWAQLRCGNSQSRFPVLPEHEMLGFGHPTGPPWKIGLPVCVALRICAQVGSGKSLGGDALAGVHMTAHPDRLVLEATDGRQILRFSFPADLGVQQPVATRLFPHWASLWELGLHLDQALQQPTEALGCWVDPERGLCWVRSNSWAAATTAMGSAYPNLDNACWDPAQAQGVWEVPTRVLRAAVEEVTAKRISQARLRFFEDHLLVQAQDPSGLLAQAQVPLATPSSDFPQPVGVLTQVFLSHLATYRSPTVHLGLQHPTRPLAVWDPAGHQQGWVSVTAVPSEVYDDTATAADEQAPVG